MSRGKQRRRSWILPERGGISTVPALAEGDCLCGRFQGLWTGFLLTPTPEGEKNQEYLPGSLVPKTLPLFFFFLLV